MSSKTQEPTPTLTAGKYLKADREQVEKFVDALFRHADPGSYVSLRVFDDTKDDAFPLANKSIFVEKTSDLIENACRLIEQAAAHEVPHVFCPPIATFRTPKKATTEDLVNGLALSVECDERAEAALQTLTQLLGPQTVVVASGGEWLNPETNSLEPKLHIHWRLKTPTRTKNDHDRLRTARERATTLVGGDPTNKSIVHPLRWPGSWHRKKEPRLATIVELNPDAEIDLEDALRVLPWREDETEHRSGVEPQAAPERVAAAVAVIPNKYPPDHPKFPNEPLKWGDWKNRGMAIWRATGGSGEGRAIFHTFSAKAKDKYDKANTDAAWNAIARSPPTSIGAGTIFHLANEVSPGFEWERELSEKIAAQLDAAGRSPENIEAALARIKDDSATIKDDPWHVESLMKATAKLRGTIKIVANALVVAKRLILSSREFVAGFVPPDYLVDGLLQRRYVYSLTGPTGSGKTCIVLRIAVHIAMGLALGDMEVEQGRVLFFAGENPDDVRA